MIEVELTRQEKYLLDAIRALKPFEHISIEKDKAGRPDTYFINRSQRVIVSELAIVAVKS